MYTSGYVDIIHAFNVNTDNVLLLRENQLKRTLRIKIITKNWNSLSLKNKNMKDK